MDKRALIRVFRKADRTKSDLLEKMIRNGWPESPQSLREFAKTCPEPIASEEGTQYALKNGVWAPTTQQDPFALSWLRFWGQDMSIPFYPGDIQAPEPPKPELDEPFEVNLTTPLIGWRSWEFEGHKDIVLTSISHSGKWCPGQPIEANCGEKTCKQSPTTACGCGIYAVDDRVDAPGVDNGVGYINGQVYGWGRYVRGESGWRAQFAYPASFYLSSYQLELVQSLKAFHVPIYVDEPVKMYSPEEDGYENWQNDPDRDSGADPEPDTEEEGDPGEE